MSQLKLRMLKRNCPECKKKTLEIPLFSAAYICRNCVSIFQVHGWFKFVLIFGAVLLYLLLLQAVLALLENESINLIGFGAVTYLVVPLVISLVLKIAKMYFGPLKLSGVKGKVRGNS
ncbi:hypothetical protein ACNKU7_18655 [Microbulbifer sp. SA54]|uniref:hypothetical protein n=1 Tax=Microbulbifer sp. SA54 TaxID=3401577 RepID=UPI003AAED596